MPEIKNSYIQDEETPCPYLTDGMKQTDKMARQLAKKGKPSQTIAGACLKCGVKFFRSEISEDDNEAAIVIYVLGKGWPDNCEVLSPKPKRINRKRW